jgi:hypothetical protein
MFFPRWVLRFTRQVLEPVFFLKGSSHAPGLPGVAYVTPVTCAVDRFVDTGAIEGSLVGDRDGLPM